MNKLNPVEAFHRELDKRNRRDAIVALGVPAATFSLGATGGWMLADAEHGNLLEHTAASLASGTLFTLFVWGCVLTFLNLRDSHPRG